MAAIPRDKVANRANVVFAIVSALLGGLGAATVYLGRMPADQHLAVPLTDRFTDALTYAGSDSNCSVSTCQIATVSIGR